MKSAHKFAFASTGIGTGERSLTFFEETLWSVAGDCKGRLVGVQMNRDTPNGAIQPCVVRVEAEEVRAE